MRKWEKLGVRDLINERGGVRNNKEKGGKEIQMARIIETVIGKHFILLL